MSDKWADTVYRLDKSGLCGIRIFAAFWSLMAVRCLWRAEQTIESFQKSEEPLWLFMYFIAALGSAYLGAAGWYAYFRVCRERRRQKIGAK